MRELSLVRFLRDDLSVILEEVKRVGVSTTLDFFASFKPAFGAQRQIAVVRALFPDSVERLAKNRRCGIGYSARSWSTAKIEAVANYLDHPDSYKTIWDESERRYKMVYLSTDEVVIRAFEPGRPYRVASVSGWLDWIGGQKCYTLVPHGNLTHPEVSLESSGSTFESSKLLTAVFPLNGPAREGRSNTYRHRFSPDSAERLAEIMAEAVRQPPVPHKVLPMAERFSGVEAEAKRLFETAVPTTLQ